MKKEVLLIYCCEFGGDFECNSEFDFGVSSIDFSCIEDGCLTISFEDFVYDKAFLLIKESLKYGGKVLDIIDDIESNDLTIELKFDPYWDDACYLYRRENTEEYFEPCFEGYYYTAYYLSNAFKLLDELFGFSPEFLASIAEEDISKFYCREKNEHDRP